MANLVGLGIITCNRSALFDKCLQSVPDVDKIVIVNDGNEYPNSIYSSKPDEIIQHKSNMGVGRSKNDALQYLIGQECKYMFLCEDDILIKNKNVCDEYIKLSEKSGLMHMNYAYHGPDNKDINGNPQPRKILEGVSLNKHLLGAFSFYNDEIIKKIGYIDEQFKNAYEHVDHTYQIIKAGYHPPFWWFADLPDSSEYISDQHDYHQKSVIRRNMLLWKLNLRLNGYRFKIKNGFTPNNIPDCNIDEVLRSLNQIKSLKRK
jgi:GT2 family glycosyltransferase